KAAKNAVKAAKEAAGRVSSLVKPGRARRNAHLAGRKHPGTGVPFDADGYPDFSKVSKKDVQIEFTGDRKGDARAANKAAGFDDTPDGYQWHHHQDGKTM